MYPLLYMYPGRCPRQIVYENYIALYMKTTLLQAKNFVALVMSNSLLCSIKRNSYVSLIYLLKKQVKKFYKHFCVLVGNTYGAPFKEHLSPRARTSVTKYHERSFIVFIHLRCIVKGIKPMTKYLSSLPMMKYLSSLIKLLTINYKFLSITNRLANSMPY